MPLVGVEYPAFKVIAEELVKQHLAKPDEQLLLAIYYAPERDQEDIFLFEVFENFGAKTIDESRNLFEISFGSTPSFPLDQGQSLHLVLTNPEELAIAAREKWELLQELRTAIQLGKAIELYADRSKRSGLWKMING